MPTEKQLDIILESEVEFNSPSTYSQMAQSNEPTIEIMNEAIALFMGMRLEETYPSGHMEHEWVPSFAHSNWCFKEPPPFDRSWSWLMPVVEKIELLENKRFGVCIDVLDTMIMDYKVGADEGEIILVQTDIYPDNGDTKISITHDAVYQFITWYQNKQKQNDGTK